MLDDAWWCLMMLDDAWWCLMMLDDAGCYLIQFAKKLYIFCYDSAENDEIHDDIDEYRTHVNIDKNIVCDDREENSSYDDLAENRVTLS